MKKSKAQNTVQATNELNKVELQKAVDEFVERTCTISASWTTSGGKKVNVSFEVTCDCTQQAACDAAYALASIVIPDK